MLGSLIPFSSKIAFVTKLSVRIPAFKLACVQVKIYRDYYHIFL